MYTDYESKYGRWCYYTTEDDLLRGEFFLKHIAKKYGLRISPHKAKVTAFTEKYPIITEIELNGNTLEQFYSFNYLWCEMSPTVHCDIENNINSYNTKLEKKRNWSFARRWWYRWRCTGVRCGYFQRKIQEKLYQLKWNFSEL